MTSIKNWLAAFQRACSEGDGTAASALFASNGMWRDYLPFGWTLQTVEGNVAISKFINSNGERTGFREATFEGPVDDVDGFFHFRTNRGKGVGHIRLAQGKCYTLLTLLEDLSGIQTGKQPMASTPQDPYVLIVGGGQSGLGLKYRRTASGYYIYVGASQMIIDGQIKLKSGARTLLVHIGSVLSAFCGFFTNFEPKSDVGHRSRCKAP